MLQKNLGITGVAMVAYKVIIGYAEMTVACVGLFVILFGFVQRFDHRVPNTTVRQRIEITLAPYKIGT